MFFFEYYDMCCKKNQTNDFHVLFVHWLSHILESRLSMDLVQRISSPLTIHLDTEFIIHSPKLTKVL